MHISFVMCSLIDVTVTKIAHSHSAFTVISFCSNFDVVFFIISERKIV